jgi:hypothetical protein
MENDVVHIRAPDWWPEPIPEGHFLQLLKSIYGTRQAARRWHKHISAWMEANCYFAVNSEKTIFMKREGKQFIINGLFVDDMMHIATNNKFSGNETFACHLLIPSYRHTYFMLHQLTILLLILPPCQCVVEPCSLWRLDNGQGFHILEPVILLHHGLLPLLAVLADEAS